MNITGVKELTSSDRARARKPVNAARGGKRDDNSGAATIENRVVAPQRGCRVALRLIQSSPIS